MHYLLNILNFRIFHKFATNQLTFITWILFFFLVKHYNVDSNLTFNIFVKILKNNIYKEKEIVINS